MRCAGSYILKEEELQILGEFNGFDCVCIHVESRLVVRYIEPVAMRGLFRVL